MLIYKLMYNICTHVHSGDINSRCRYNSISSDIFLTHGKDSRRARREEKSSRFRCFLMKTSSDWVSIDPSFHYSWQKHASTTRDPGSDWHSDFDGVAGKLDRSLSEATRSWHTRGVWKINSQISFCSFRACRDTGNGKKGTKSSPQQDKAAADAAGRKAAGAAAPESGSEMAEGNQSPPKAEVDDSPLQHAMDRNKECEYKSVIGSGRILIWTFERIIELSIGS